MRIHLTTDTTPLTVSITEIAGNVYLRALDSDEREIAGRLLSVDEAAEIATALQRTALDAIRPYADAIGPATLAAMEHEVAALAAMRGDDGGR
ncbi:MAG: hypothetical protein HYV09_26505 [Deltaproteobacteria bacterium]|nr:hypothetical protein [Deltaproteobacteria bacterium]